MGDVSNLYFVYTNKYNIPSDVKAPASAPASAPTLSGTCPQEEPCDICNGPIANPLNVVNIAGLPATACGAINYDTANKACLVSGYTRDRACEAMGNEAYDICCVADGNGSGPSPSTPSDPLPSTPAAAPASTESSSSSGGISGGAIVGILAGVSFLVGLGFLAVRKSKSDIDTDFKETDSNENTNDETTGDDFVGASL